MKGTKEGKREHVSREILFYLLVGGAVVLALSTAPYALAAAIPIARFQKKQFQQRKLQNSFYYLRRSGLISVESKKGRVHLSLTEKGKKAALHRSLLTKVTVSKPKRWDRKWRIIIFDIKSEHKLKRDALRAMLGKVGFIQLQKSVWIYPFDCRKGVDQLKSFFELSDDECRLITTQDIGRDQKFRKHFKI